jgi:excisionase family DNA binding protein
MNNQQQTPTREVLLVEEVAEILGISRSKAYAWVNETTPFTVLKCGRSIRIPKQTFYAWLNAKTDTLNEVM